MMNDKVEKGMASVDRPWLKYYPEVVKRSSIPNCTLTQYLKDHMVDFDETVVDYYGYKLTWKEIFQQVDDAAKSLKVLGIEVEDKIPCFLQSVPQFIILLLAAEKVGAALVCRDDEPEQCAVAIRNAGSEILFAHDYVSREEEEKFLNETQLKKMITISPYYMTKEDEIPDYIKANIESHYTEESACNPENLTWEAFLALGKDYDGEVEAEEDPTRPLLCAYTSGSTGVSKQVIHTAYSIVGILFQLTVFSPPQENQLTWMLTCLPPALVAAVIAMTLYPLSSNKLLILDPFCAVEDVDLEMMRIKPNCWSMITVFFEVLMQSDRIPEDYSMSHLYMCGSGAEPMNNKQIKRVQEFFKKHDCPSLFSIAYGQSEGGSGFTMPCPTVPLENCCYGIPMPATVLSSFDEETNRELGYGELGEICKNGPGVMLGYQDEESTAQVLKKHDDGKMWLHTGDYGYITEEGILHVLGRGRSRRYGGGYLFDLVMENKVIDLPGVKDAFFLCAPDKEHEGYFLPYMYLCLEEGYSLEEVKESIFDALEPHEYPVEINLIDKRPYFHYKTNRKELRAEIMSR
jgi:acyl-coenzyme A synthetase/AMP-(fatty) acid ligase